MKELKLETTERGTVFTAFWDSRYHRCILQEAVGLKNRIWLGVAAEDCMLLDRETIAALLPHLQRFVETGRLQAVPEETGATS